MAARRTVSSRLFASFGLVLLAFAITVGWSLWALREGAREAELLRAGYVPLQLELGEALAQQNVFNAQLNHITSARNPSDVQDWLETARRARPVTFARLTKVAKGLPANRPKDEAFRAEIVAEIGAIETVLSASPETFSQLFAALAAGDRDAADRARETLIQRETEGAARLRAVRTRTEQEIEKLTAAAQTREDSAIALLVGLAALTFIVGGFISLYARRVLRPLVAVTSRARAVADGDLTPHPVVADDSEIGELAETFESMVDAMQRARADLVQAERLATIGKMAAHITHEIRNPLSSMGLNIELLEEELAMAGDNEQAQLVAAIKREAARLSRIAEQYLSVARRPRPALQRESVSDLIDELLAFMRIELERAGVTVKVESDEGLPEVLLDESQFRQALLNLVRNAQEAMPKGGRLGITTARAVGGGVDITIDDEGSGIPEDARATIFDPFFTTKERGTGLGLAVTRDIIEAHGGTIVCDASPYGGTRFRIHLREDAKESS